MSALNILTGCLKTAQAPTEPKAIRVWWGNKEDIKNFMDSPSAQSLRWVVEAVGD